VNIVDGVFIMETSEDKKGFGYDTNHLWVIEMRTSLKWLPIMPPRAFGSLDVAHVIIKDMTGLDYKEVLFCDNPEYRIIEYSSAKTNEF
jgi:hypothetical protein